MRVRPSMAAAMSSSSSRLPRLGHRPHLDAALAEVEPGILIGRVFLGGDNDVVARLPGIALGDDADAFAGVLDEGDVERVGIEQPAEKPAHFLDAIKPAAVVDGAVLGQVDGVFGQGVLGQQRQRGHGGVIEKRPAARHRKFRRSAFPVHGRLSPGVLQKSHRQYRPNLAGRLPVVRSATNQ